MELTQKIPRRGDLVRIHGLIKGSGIIVDYTPNRELYVVNTGSEHMLHAPYGMIDIIGTADLSAFIVAYRQYKGSR